MVAIQRITNPITGQCVPQPYLAVSRGAGEQRLAGRRDGECHRSDGTAVADQRVAKAIAGIQIPQPHHAASGGAGQESAAVGGSAERDRGEPVDLRRQNAAD